MSHIGFDVSNPQMFHYDVVRLLFDRFTKR